MTSSVVAGIIIALVIVLAVGLFFVANRRSRSQRLQQHFGPEYDRRVEVAGGDRKAAESQLRTLVDEHRKLDVKPLEPAARDRYAEEWRAVQTDFVDEPGRSVAQADELVARVMRDRGYPVDDFDRQADLVAVEHPGVVEHYRAAHAVHQRATTEQVETEDLRQAFVHYRSLFDDLLDRSPATEAMRPAADRTPDGEQPVIEVEDEPVERSPR